MKMHCDLLNIQITSGCLWERSLEIKKDSEISALSLCSALGILSQLLRQDTKLGAVLLFLVHIFVYPSINLFLAIYWHLCCWYCPCFGLGVSRPGSIRRCDLTTVAWLMRTTSTHWQLNYWWACHKLSLEPHCLLQHRNWCDTRSLSKGLFCWTNHSLQEAHPLVDPSGLEGREGGTQIMITSTVMLMGRKEGGSVEAFKEDGQIPQQHVRSHVLGHLS